MQEYYSVLAQSPLFSGIDRKDLPGMLRCMQAKVLPVKKGQTIFQEGEVNSCVGIVLSGSVQLIREDYYGNRSIMGRAGPRELFGEAYAFAQERALPVTVQADMDGEVILLDSRRMSACCSNVCEFHNRLIANLLRLVSDKNLMLHQKLQITSKRTTRDKLMAYLLNQAKEQGSDQFVIPYDRQELADYLEVDRSGLSAEISKLRKEGVLESEKSTFRLLNKFYV